MGRERKGRNGEKRRIEEKGKEERIGRKKMEGNDTETRRKIRKEVDNK